MYDDFNQFYYYWTVLDGIHSTNPMWDRLPEDRICIPDVREIQNIAFSSRNREDALTRINNLGQRVYGSNWDPYNMQLFRGAYVYLGSEN